MHSMKILIMTILFMAVIYFAETISSGNSAVQLAAVILCGLVLVWYALRAICCACSQGDKSSCSKQPTQRYVMNDRPRQPISQTLETVHVGTYERGEGTMKTRRAKSGKRRQNEDMPRVPFKDSMGVTIYECRRKIPDRRINNIQAEWIEQIVIR